MSAVKTPAWKTVWITGASSGIGRELALKLASRGVRVAMTARSEDKLAALAASGPNLVAFPGDVTDPGSMAAVVEAVEAAFGPIDLAILSAGRFTAMRTSEYDVAVATEENAVNYLGVVNALGPLLPRMIGRGRGQIGIMSSAAGFCGLPKTGAYGPTKAALIVLAETLRVELEEKGVLVSVAMPGFIDTPLLANNDMATPYIVPVDYAADQLLKGLEKAKFDIAFPFWPVLAMKLLRRVSYRLFFPLVRRNFPDVPPDARATTAADR